MEGKRVRFGRVLKVYRAWREITTRELASEIGISASTICRIETGKGQPDGPTAVKLFAWLLSEEE